MTTSKHNSWKPGESLPYVVPFGSDSMLAIELPAGWLRADRDGQPLLLPPAIRAIDRLRAVFSAARLPTPGFIASLREAMGLSQAQFGSKLGVSKMTVSRWECGRIKPSVAAANALRRLQVAARRRGLRIDGERRKNGMATVA